MSESELLAKAQAGDTQAEQAMLLRYDPLCHRLARKYFTSGMEYDDVLQEARLGLLRAVRLFNPEKGANFITYAYIAIRRNVARSLAEYGAGVRLPVSLVEQVSRLTRVQERAFIATGEMPTIAECAQQEGASNSETLAFLPGHISSLDEFIGEEETRLGELIPCDRPTPEEHLIASEDDPERAALVRCLDRLPAQEREVIARRIGLPPYPKEGSLADVAGAMGCSREWVRTIESRAVRRLRSMLGLRDTGLGTSLGLNLHGTPTDRQRKIIELWNAGLTQKEIAEGLGSSQSHVSTVLRSYASWLHRKPQRGSKPGEWGHGKAKKKCAA
jgi:RNA polymerase sigma factor (sigma-70 family)